MPLQPSVGVLLSLAYSLYRTWPIVIVREFHRENSHDYTIGNITVAVVVTFIRGFEKLTSNKSVLVPF